MADKKTINILVIGVTGTGKSTWINSLANYLMYDSLEEALKGEVHYVIPQSFEYADKDYKSHRITIGNPSNLQNNPHGSQSVTKIAQVYSFQHPNYTLNFIDTPGVGDTANEDEKLIKETLSALSSFEEIHGICILIKTNETKLTPGYRYALNQLLMYLHKDAANNVHFVFTNSRVDTYAPGNARSLLRIYLLELKEKKQIEIKLNKETMYCIDNETFRYQCIHRQNPDLLKDINVENYKKSWNMSYIAAQELIQRLQNVNAYNPHHSISISEARTIIMFLIPTMISVNTAIQQNAKNIEKKNVAMVNDLLKNLGIEESTIEIEKIEYPRTVCTATKCIGVTKGMTYYKQVCHDHCYLRGIPLKSMPEKGLKNCAAMDRDDNCKHCECSWNVHMHIDFFQKIKTGKEGKINKKLSEIKNMKKNEAVEKLKEINNELENEAKTINNSINMCVAFLRQHAIFEYNDAHEQYLNVEIRNQEALENSKTPSLVLPGLKKQLADFQALSKNIDSIPKDGQQEVTKKDISKMKHDLFKLELFGEKIQELYNMSVAANITRLNDSEFIKKQVNKDVFSRKDCKQ